MTVIALCGSVRFRDTFDKVERTMVKAGHTVLVPSWAFDESRLSPSVKEILDAQHRAKIGLADEVYVLDVDEYVGDSTRSEIGHAIRKEKPVRYLSEDFRVAYLGGNHRA